MSARSLADIAKDAQARGESAIDLFWYAHNGSADQIARLGLSEDEAGALRSLPPEVPNMLRLYRQHPARAAHAYMMDEETRALFEVLAAEKAPKIDGKPLPRQNYPTTATRAAAVAEDLGELFEEVDRERAEALAGVLNALPKQAKKRLAPKPPILLSTRKRIRRRQATHPYPDAATVTLGPSLKDLDAWQKRATSSQDLTERAIARRLSGAGVIERSLAYVLWHLAICVDPERAGYIGAITGFSRLMLAALLPARNAQGRPVTERTISRAAAALRTRLGGLLSYHQPSPDAMQANSLPGATHFYDDGTTGHQAFNLYRIFPAGANGRPAFEKANRDGKGAAGPRLDPGARYSEVIKNKEEKAEVGGTDREQRSESSGRGPPIVDPARRGAPHSPPATAAPPTAG